MVINEFSVSSTLRIGPSILEAGGDYRCLANGFTPDSNVTMVPSNISTIVYTGEDPVISSRVHFMFCLVIVSVCSDTVFCFCP